jgi:hypothetical protein
MVRDAKPKGGFAKSNEKASEGIKFVEFFAKIWKPVGFSCMNLKSRQEFN